MNRRALAELLFSTAADLDQLNYPLAGIVRQGALELLDDDALLGERDPGGCPACGGPIEQPARGRRRTFCSDACRKGAHRRARAAEKQTKCMMDPSPMSDGG